MRCLSVIAVATVTLFVPAGCERRTSRPNIVLVVLDTVRRDATSLDGPATPDTLRGAGLTPNLDRLSTEGVTFTQAWSAAPWTVPSHASIFTGLLPSRHGCVMSHVALDPDLPTAAELLGGVGYRTVAFFSNPWLSDKATRLLRGFDRRYGVELADRRTMTSKESDQGGAASLRDIRDWFARQRGDERPFLLFVNFLEAHLGYDPPPDYRSVHLADLPTDDAVPIRWAHEVNAGARDPATVDWDRVTRLYAGDVWSADRLLGELLAILEAQGLSDETIVIVTSDHGENLGEHGLAEHQFSVHETLLAVPLVVRVPAHLASARLDGIVGAGSRREEPVMTTDLYATLLDLAGLDDAVSEAVPSSRSLLVRPERGDRFTVAEYDGPGPLLLAKLQQMNAGLDRDRLSRPLRTVRLGELRLTVDDDAFTELHDLAADPGQARNLAGARPEDVRKLRAILTAASGARRRDARPAPPMDEETRQRLEALGYVN